MLYEVLLCVIVLFICCAVTGYRSSLLEFYVPCLRLLPCHRNWGVPQNDMNVLFRGLSRLCDLLMNFFSEVIHCTNALTGSYLHSGASIHCISQSFMFVRGVYQE